MKKLMLAALIGTVALAPAAHAETTHCPDHNSPDVTKVEGNNNDVVPPAGTLICVKASTGNTGQLTADGETSLIAYVEDAGIVNDNGQPHDVSYYVVYGVAGGTGADDTAGEDSDAKDSDAKDSDAKDSDAKDSDAKDSGDSDGEESDEYADTDDDERETTDTTIVTVEPDVEAKVDSDTLSVASGGTASSGTPAGGETNGTTTANPTEAAGNAAGTTTDGATGPTEPGTQVLGETVERGPSTLARTGAGVGGLALLGGLLCGGGPIALLARRLLRIG